MNITDTLIHKIASKVYNRKKNLFIDMIDTNRASVRDFITKYAHKDWKVIDIGSGERCWEHLFKKGNYFALDNCIGESTWDYKVDINADVVKIPVKGNTFDAVIMTEVLEHLPEPKIALKEVNRILKPGGILLLTAPQGWAEHEVPHDFFRYTKYGLIYLLEETNYKILKIHKKGGYFKYISFRLWHIIFMKFLNKNIFTWLIKLPMILILIPVSILCYFLDDILDKEKELTLGYNLVAIKNKNNQCGKV